MLNLVPAGVTRSIARQVLKTKMNSPHIFFVAGIAGAVGSTVLACRATLKLEPVVDTIREDLVEVKQMGRPSESGGDLKRYPDRQYYQDLTYVYAKSAKAVVRLYGPSIVLGAASVGALTGSHVQLTRRNTALTATLAVVSQAYEDYRHRVQEELGEDRERDLYRDIQEETEKVGGKNQRVRKIGDPNKFSPYAKIFDATNYNWKNDAELNKLFITCQQQHMNNRLQVYGWVLLNDVYEALGFEKTRAGSVVGWILDPDGDGDNFIDFGMYMQEDGRFINGLETNVWLDFNVDGVIHHKIPE